MKFNPGLAALAVGAFGIGMTEFAPMGLLPVIAGDLGVSVPVAGILISAYAIGVVVGAPLMTLTTGRMNRRTLLIGLAGIFTAGNLLAAMSQSYEVLLIARVITAFNHGAFFGVGSIVAASLVPAERKAGAVAAMFMGLTIANVVGVPFVTFLGEQLGWRSAFWIIAALGLVTMAALRAALPSIPGEADGNPLAELKVLTRRQVVGALALTAVGSSAMFTVFSYIAPILKVETGASLGFITAMLVTYGVGLSVGNLLGGKFADKSVTRTLVLSLSGMALVLCVFAAVMPYTVPTAIVVFLFGVASFALVPPLQMQVMEAAHDAPSLAASVNIGAFNLGNALGAALGGAVIAGGLGYPAVALAGAGTSLTGLVMLIVLLRTAPRQDAVPAASG